MDFWTTGIIVAAEYHTLVESITEIQGIICLAVSLVREDMRMTANI